MMRTLLFRSHISSLWVVLTDVDFYHQGKSPQTSFSFVEISSTAFSAFERKYLAFQNGNLRGKQYLPAVYHWDAGQTGEVGQVNVTLNLNRRMSRQRADMAVRANQKCAWSRPGNPTQTPSFSSPSVFPEPGSLASWGVCEQSNSFSTNLLLTSITQLTSFRRGHKDYWHSKSSDQQSLKKTSAFLSE